MGLPAGRTEAEVKAKLNSTYDELNSAVIRYGELLYHQDHDTRIEKEIINIDRSRFSGTYVVIIITDNDHIRIPVRIDLEGIQADRDYLATANEDGKGYWPISKLDDFIERLGFAIQYALGIKPAD